MLEMFFSVLAVSAIAAFLAALLVVANRFISNYGECEITVNDEKKFTLQGGVPLLEGLMSNKLFIPSACGGRGTCGYCKVKVVDGGGPVVPTEEPYLSQQELEDGIRLSCQVKVRGNIRVEVPRELLSVREYTCTCTKIRQLTHDIREFRFELLDPPEMDFVPGQYIQLYCPAYDGNEEVYRAYSIASNPAEKGALELVIRYVPGGICTTWCFNHLEEGDVVRLNGPYGDFRLSDTSAPAIFVAGGSGMAPMKCILHHMKNAGDDRAVTYFFGANLVNELFYLDLMREFEVALPNFTFVPVVAKSENGEGWDGEEGLVTEALGRGFSDVADKEAYLCGSPGMIDATINVIGNMGMPEDHIYFDKF